MMTEPTAERADRIESPPRGWRRVRLGELLRLRQEVVHPRDKPRGRAIFVGLEHIESGTGRRTGAVDVEKAHLTGRKPKFGKGDIVYGYLRPYLNKVWVAEFDGLCSVDQYVYVVDGERADTAFLAWFMRSPVYLARAPIDSTPGQLPRIRTEEVAAVEIILPPLPQQRRIAGVLDEQMAAVERARAAAQARLKAAQALPARYLRAAFSASKTGEWPWARIADVCQLLPSKSVASDGDAWVQAVTTACLTESGFRASGIKPARMRSADARECAITPGDILVARSNTPDLVGRAAMFTGDPPGAVASDLTVRIRTGPRLLPSFTAGCLSFLYVTGYCRERAGGASGSMKKITRSHLETERIPVPSLPEQETVAANLHGCLVAVNRVREAIKQEVTRISALPAALLRRAFSGEL